MAPITYEYSKDVGNSHVIDYYLMCEIKRVPPWHRTVHFEPDFDFTTEQREGWCYGQE